MTHTQPIRGALGRWALVVLALVLAGCGPLPTAAPTAAPTPTASPRLTAAPTSAVSFAEGLAVTIKDKSYQPPALAVAVHSIVTWTNADDQEHSVTQGEPGAQAGFDSGILEPNETFAFTFDEPGDYVFFCRIHNEMRGIVRVTG